MPSKTKTAPKSAAKPAGKKWEFGSIIWKSKDVDVSLIDPTPNNYKIKTDLGMERLQTSLAKFGLAGAVIVNPSKNGRFVLIDGNSRLEKAKEKKLKKIGVSFPNKPLTPKQFQEMSAMFDFAKAGEVDMERIQQDLGTSKDFYEAYGLEVPMSLLDNMGAKAQIMEYPEEGGGTAKAGKKGKDAPPAVADIKLVQAFFSTDQEERFRKMEEVLQKVFKVDTTTDVIFKSVEFAFKSIKKK